jgi:hypothetical protein
VVVAAHPGPYRGAVVEADAMSDVSGANAILDVAHQQHQPRGAGATLISGAYAYVCPVCFHGSAEPFRCGGPHPRPSRKRLYYDFVDAVPVVPQAEVERLREEAVSPPYTQVVGRNAVVLLTPEQIDVILRKFHDTQIDEPVACSIVDEMRRAYIALGRVAGKRP